MKEKTLIHTLLDLLKSNRFHQVFDLLGESVKHDSPNYDKLVMLQQRFNRNQDKEMMGIATAEEYQIEANKITQALLQLIRSLDIANLPEVKPKPVEVFINPILVITNEDRKNFFERFFSGNHFTKVTVINEDTPLPSKDYDLIIFDNQDFGYCPGEDKLQFMTEERRNHILKRTALMEEYIDKTGSFIFHFGDIFYWVRKYRDRVQAANSRFSLFARTKEMIEFINNYRANPLPSPGSKSPLGPSSV